MALKVLVRVAAVHEKSNALPAMEKVTYALIGQEIACARKSPIAVTKLLLNGA
jgi:hypothetical protein